MWCCSTTWTRRYSQLGVRGLGGRHGPPVLLPDCPSFSTFRGSPSGIRSVWPVFLVLPSFCPNAGQNAFLRSPCRPILNQWGAEQSKITGVFMSPKHEVVAPQSGLHYATFERSCRVHSPSFPLFSSCPFLARVFVLPCFRNPFAPCLLLLSTFLAHLHIFPQFLVWQHGQVRPGSS